MEYKNKKVCNRIPLHIMMTPEILSVIDEHRGKKSRREYMEECVLKSLGMKKRIVTPQCILERVE
ncbi:MAG TPA: hypothetical protein VGK06_15495 [Methanosarcina sp.]|jgi:hypothetical protein